MAKSFRVGSSVVKMDINKLESLMGSLKAKMVTEVGVLGAKAKNRKAAGSLISAGGHKKIKRPSDMTNAEIGLVHEKGSLSRGIPARSFLKLPLTVKSSELLTVKKKLWDKYLAGESTIQRLKEAYRDLGLIAEKIIQEAFATGGFGRWAKLSHKTIARKKSSAILIDTAQLRRSITSRVAKR